MFLPTSMNPHTLKYVLKNVSNTNASKMPSSMAVADKTSNIFLMLDHLAILTIYTQGIKT